MGEGKHTSFGSASVERKPDGGISLLGHWNLRGLKDRVDQLQHRLRETPASENWDLREVDALDTAGAMLLWHAWDGERPADLQLRKEHQPLFDRIAKTADRDPPANPKLLDWIDAFGASVAGFLAHLSDLLVLQGRLALATLHLLRHPQRLPLREISATFYHAGARALVITALVGFLIGVVISYLSALQLKAYGAESFIVDILSIAVLRELGPLLAAILVAGRSGSAMTAELGVMRVTQELDALSALGVSHTLRLVVPKVAALAIVMPLLVFWTDVIALLGGMLSAYLDLGIGFGAFLQELPGANLAINLWVGLGKAVVFGIVIALVACHYGLRIQPNSQSLGAGTTASVVTSITLVILFDAVFAVVLQGVGLD